MSIPNENQNNEELENKDVQSKKASNDTDKKSKKGSVVTKESWSAVGALFSALAIIMLFTGDLVFGKVGAGVTELMLGVFGYFAYPVVLGVFYLSVTSFFDLKFVKNRKAGWTLGLSLLFLALTIHAATTVFSWPLSEYLGKCFVAGGSFATSTLCGIVGALPVCGLYALVGGVGAIIVFTSATTLCVYLFVRTIKGGEKTTQKKGWFIKKKEKPADMPAQTEDVAATSVPQQAPAYGYAQQPSYAQPMPGYTQPSEDASTWQRPASFSPFSQDGQASSLPTDRAFTREESKAFLFGGSPADSYNKNLFFDRNASVNNRPGASQTPMPSYTQAYEQSLRSVEEKAPEKIVTDFTAPTPSYTHPTFSEPRRDDTLLRTPSAFDDTRTVTPVETPVFPDRSRESLPVEEPSVPTFRGRDEEISSRDIIAGFDRSPLADFSEPIERRGVDRDLFDKKEEPSLGNLRDTGRDAFVSPFSDVDFKDDDTDFMPRKDDKIDLTPKAEPEIPPVERISSRISEPRSARFVETTPMVEPKQEEPVAPPPVQVPKIIRPYSAPPLHFFNCTEVKPDCDQQEVENNKRMILATLDGFGIKDATISSVTFGPTVTRYNVVTPINVSSKKIIALADQFAVNLHAENGVNVSFNYGDGATSIEVPNKNRQFVHLGAMLTGAGFVSAKPNSLTFALGVDVANEKIYGDVAKMTHLLVAGASGMGKSAFLRSLIISLIYKYSPEELRLLLIDPKMTEFTLYKGIPHLIIDEIMCRPQQAVQALRWAIGEMERRYELFQKKILAGTYVVNIDGYNANLEKGETKLPKIVIIVDELADLMSVAKKDIEDSIQRLTAKARAAGIHMILATQRPSVDIITGVIKNNLPTRIACAVPSEINSRVVLDASGAEKLLGMGDMMYSMAGFKAPVRVQSPYIDDAPAQLIVNYIRDNNDCDFNDAARDYINNTGGASSSSGGAIAAGGGEVEPIYIEALKCAIQNGSASISMLQRKCSVGFNKAGKIIEWMEEMQYIAEFDGSPKPRKTLISKEEFEELYGEF